MSHLGEGLHRARHLLEQLLLETVRNDLRQAVEHVRAQRPGADVLDRDPTHQRRQVLARQREVDDPHAQPERRVRLLDLERIGAHAHALHHAGRLRGEERLVQRGAGGRVEPEETAKAEQRRQRVGLVGGLELEHRAIAVAHAEAGDALAAIGIEHPHRLAVLARDAGQETRERPRGVEVVENEAVVVGGGRGRLHLRRPWCRRRSRTAAGPPASAGDRP